MHRTQDVIFAHTHLLTLPNNNNDNIHTQPKPTTPTHPPMSSSSSSSSSTFFANTRNRQRDSQWQRDAVRARSQLLDAMQRFAVYVEDDYRRVIDEVWKPFVSDEMQFRPRPRPPRLSHADQELRALAKLDPMALKPHQLQHVDRLHAILQAYCLSIDATFAGGGKTLSAIETGRRGAYTTLVVITVANHESFWWRTAAQQKMHITTVLSYGKLCGNCANPPSHGYLERQQPVDDRDGSRATFKVTAKFYELLATERVLLVVDEGQQATNGRDRTRAIWALTTAMLSSSSSSTSSLAQRMTRGSSRHGIWVGSALMSSNKDHILAMIQYTGMLPVGGGRRLGAGVEELGFDSTPTGYRGSDHIISLVKGGAVYQFYDWCKQLDKEKAESAYRYHLRYEERDRVCVNRTDGLSKAARKNDFVYELFMQCVKPRIASEMENPDPGRKQITNVFGAWETREEHRVFQEAVRELHRAHVRRTAAKDATEHTQAMVDMTAARQLEDGAKVPLAVRLIRRKLLADPLCRVVMGVHYLDDVEALMLALAEYFPMMLAAGVSAKEKERIVREFTRVPTDAELASGNWPRIIIGTIQTMGEAISLNDTTGKHQVHLIGFPSFHARLSRQFEGRSDRHTTLGKCPVVWLYGRATFGDLPPQASAIAAASSSASASTPPLPIEEGREERILRSLDRKASVMKDWASGQAKQGEQFADDYTCLQEYQKGKLREVQLAPSFEAGRTCDVKMLTVKRAVERVAKRRAEEEKTGDGKRQIIVLDGDEAVDANRRVKAADVERAIKAADDRMVDVDDSSFVPTMVLRKAVATTSATTSPLPSALPPPKPLVPRPVQPRPLQPLQLPPAAVSNYPSSIHEPYRPLSTVPEEEQEGEQKEEESKAQRLERERDEEAAKRKARTEAARVANAQPWQPWTF